MRKLLVLFLMVMVSGWAFAHGPTPQKVEKSLTIKAPPAKVWALIKDFGAMQKWHPEIVSVKIEKQGEDTFRTLTIKDGNTVYEKLRSIDDATMKLRYEIISSSKPLPFADYNSAITVSAGNTPNETVVTWVGRFYRAYKLNPPIPPGQDDESAVKAVTAIYESGLAQLAKVAVQ